MGWIAGTMAVTDPVLLAYVPSFESTTGVVKVQSWAYQTAGVVGALVVVLVGLGQKRWGRASDLSRDLPP